MSSEVLLLTTIGVVITGLFLFTRIDRWRVIYGVTLFTFFGATSTVPELPPLAFYARYVALAVLAVWTWKGAGPESRPLRESQPYAQVLIQGLWLGVAVSLASTLWSVDRFNTLAQSVALGFLVAVVHGLIVRRWTDRTTVANDFAAAVVTFAAIFTVGLFAAGIGRPEARAYNGRFQGLFDNPNMLSLVAALVLPAAFGVWRATGQRLYLLAALPAAGSLVMAQSRTALVALVAAAALVLVRRGPARAAKVLIPVAAGGFFLWLIFGSSAVVTQALLSFRQRFSANEGGDLFNTRPEIWETTVALWWQRPATGYGFGAGPTLFQQLLLQRRISFGNEVVHNSYLQWLLELGVLGMAPLLMLVVALTHGVLRGPVKDPLDASLVWLLAAGLTIQLTESAMFGIGQPYPYLFWLAAAAVAAHPHSDSEGGGDVAAAGTGSSSQLSRQGSAVGRVRAQSGPRGTGHTKRSAALTDERTAVR